MSHAFFDFIENKVSPIAARAGSQRHIMAIRDGFVITSYSIHYTKLYEFILKPSN